MHRDIETLLIPITDFRPYGETMEFFQEINHIYHDLPENSELTQPAVDAAVQKANYRAMEALEAVIDTHVYLTTARALGLNMRLYSNLYGYRIAEEQKREAEEAEPANPACCEEEDERIPEDAIAEELYTYANLTPEGRSAITEQALKVGHMVILMPESATQGVTTLAADGKVTIAAFPVEPTAAPAPPLHPELVDNDRPYLDALHDLARLLTELGSGSYADRMSHDPQVVTAVDRLSGTVNAFARRGYATNAPQEADAG